MACSAARHRRLSATEHALELNPADMLIAFSVLPDRITRALIWLADQSANGATICIDRLFNL